MIDTVTIYNHLIHRISTLREHPVRTSIFHAVQLKQKRELLCHTNLQRMQTNFYTGTWSTINSVNVDVSDLFHCILDPKQTQASAYKNLCGR